MDERIKALGELNDKITRIGAVLCDLDLGEEVEIEGVKYLHEKNEIDRSIIKATTPSGRTLRGLCSTDPLEPYHIHNLAPQCLGQSVSMVVISKEEQTIYLRYSQ